MVVTLESRNVPIDTEVFLVKLLNDIIAIKKFLHQCHEEINCFSSNDKKNVLGLLLTDLLPIAFERHLKTIFSEVV